MTKNSFVIAFVSSILSGYCHAAIVPWQDTIPSALKPFQNNPVTLAQLAEKDTVTYGQIGQAVTIPSKKGLLKYHNVRFQSAAIVLPIPAEQVKQTLSNYQQYVGLFPTLTKAKAVEQSGQITQMKYHIHVPIPVPILSFKEDVVLQHHINDHSISTLIIDSPIQYGVGKFEWFALDNNRTLLTLTQWGDLDKPKGFLVSTILKALPEVKLGIPAGVDAFILEALKRRFSPDGQIPAITSHQLPNKTLNPQQLQAVKQLSLQSVQPVMFIHRSVKLPYSNGQEALRFVSSYSVINAPVEKARQTLGSPQSYKQLFRQVSKVTTTPMENQKGVEAAITVKVGLGVIAIPFRLNLRYFNEGNNTVRYQANGGDIEYMQGRLRFETLSDQQTLLVMNSAGKIGDSAPFLLKLSKHLPYSEFLPTVGGAPILINKANAYLAKNP
jgi:carbon monoxide dehydrogenase subunit G